ncbi:MAG: hypothetical protein MMC33_004013 [Icmadophila ericetorum]|nr:hypothetical protein [Icmadophila ericetorum]
MDKFPKKRLESKVFSTLEVDTGAHRDTNLEFLSNLNAGPGVPLPLAGLARDGANQENTSNEPFSALEVNQDAQAPQAIFPDEGMQVKPSDESRDTATNHLNYNQPKTRKSLWIVLSILLFLVVVGIGAGTGEWAGRRHGTTIPIAPPSPDGMMENTDFATTEWTNGEIRLFFQEIDGTIRQAVSSEETGAWAWSTPKNDIVATNAKLETVNATTPCINLFFLNSTNDIQYWQYVADTWAQQPTYGLLQPGNNSRLAYTVYDQNGTNHNWLFSQAANGSLQTAFVTGLPNNGTPWEIVPWVKTDAPINGTCITSLPLAFSPNTSLVGSRFVYQGKTEYVTDVTPFLSSPLSTQTGVLISTRNLVILIV